MEYPNTAQDVYRCDLCEDPSVKSYCLYCHVILCKACKEKHVSGAYNKHAIVPFSERRSTLFFKKCGRHPNKTCELRCKDCNFIVCSSCIVSKKHRGHIFKNIIDFYGKGNEPLKENAQESETSRFSSHTEEFLEETDKKLSWSENITTEELKEQFVSFNIKFPDDHLRHSFVHAILNEDLRKQLMFEIRSLSNGIVLTNFPNKTHVKQPGDARVFEVEVVNIKDELCVVQKVISGHDFFSSYEDNLPKVILIRSKSIPIVEAKLTVYKKYKNVIKKRKIFLQHVDDEFDEIAKLRANEKLSSFCVFVESLINTFTIEILTTFNKQFDKSLTPAKIGQLCFGVFMKTKHETFASVESKSDWRRYVADEIQKRICRLGEPVFVDTLEKITNICRKTVEDLSLILNELEDYQDKVHPEDQSIMVSEWCKREVLKDKSLLQKQHSIVQFIAGYRGGRKPVVKVYLRKKDGQVEMLFKNCCKRPKETEFEFVNIDDNANKISTEVKQIKFYEERARPIDISTMKKLGQVIQEHGEKIYARYSNVVGIGVSQVRRVGNTIKEEPCIVLYCLDKTLIPYGESPLPKYIAGWPCDLREDIVMFGGYACPDYCPSSNPNFPEPGCSIGIPSDKSAGSVGFLVEPTNPVNNFGLGCGFLTASHVAVKSFEVLYRDESLLSSHYRLALKEHFIVHPSCQDSGHIGHKVGEVVESYCGNYGLNKIGMDFALVKNNIFRQQEKESLPVFNDQRLSFTGTVKVIKTGRTTGTTIGNLKNNVLTVRVIVGEPLEPGSYFTFFNCYEIGNEKNQTFFKDGDSGSGVYVIENDGTLKPLGIAFAYLQSQSKTAVCRIDEIVDKFGLQIVRYKNSPSLNVTEEEPMDVTTSDK